MVDLNGLHKRLKHKLDPAIQVVIESGQFINGPAVHSFSNNENFFIILIDSIFFIKLFYYIYPLYTTIIIDEK